MFYKRILIVHLQNGLILKNMNDYLTNLIEKPKSYQIDRKNKIITINWENYKYNAFSIVWDWIKIYKWNEILIKL